MPATEAPASQQAAITACLNSSVWFRLRRLGFSISIVSTIVFGGHYLHGLSPQFTDDFAGCLQPNWRGVHRELRRKGVTLDPTLADVILDRLVHQAHSLNLDGESLRKKRKPE